MRAPIRPVRGRWPRWVETRTQRFLREDPRAILDDDVEPERFRLAMSSLHVGDTIKITKSDRHPQSDALLTEHLDLTNSTILDIGASDGSTSIDLIRRVGTFDRYIIADLYLNVTAVPVGRLMVFRDQSGTDILVAGARWLAWPARSPIVKILCRPVTSAARRSPRAREVLLLNPAVRDLLANDERVTSRVHDIFTRWTGPRPDVIKVANVLRRLYFSDERIAQALGVLLDNLVEGGHLLIIDNPMGIAGIDERGGLYRRQEGKFVLVARTEHQPEISDLIELTGGA